MNRGQKRGELTEQRFLEAFKKLPKDAPKWFTRVRRAPHSLDMRGVDFQAYIQTKNGNKIRVPVQVKSSEKGRERFLSKKSPLHINNILIVVIDPMTSDQDIREILFALLMPLYENDASFGEFYRKLFSNRVHVIGGQKYY